MVRALTRSIFGRNAGLSFCSIRTARTPRRPRSMASVSPVGPAPTIRTSQSIVFYPSRGAWGVGRRAKECADLSLDGRERSLIQIRFFILKLLERLIGRVAALLRRGVDILVEFAREIDGDLVLAPIAAIELDADDVVLGIAYSLERRLRDPRAAEIRG